MAAQSGKSQAGHIRYRQAAQVEPAKIIQRVVTTEMDAEWPLRARLCTCPEISPESNSVSCRLYKSLGWDYTDSEVPGTCTTHAKLRLPCYTHVKDMSGTMRVRRTMETTK